MRSVSKRPAARDYVAEDAAARKPPGYWRVKPVRRPRIEPVISIIHQILADDAKAPKKQRHTAKRIGQRLRDEHGFPGKYTNCA